MGDHQGQDRGNHDASKKERGSFQNGRTHCSSDPNDRSHHQSMNRDVDDAGEAAYQKLIEHDYSITSSANSWIATGSLPTTNTTGVVVVAALAAIAAVPWPTIANTRR